MRLASASRVRIGVLKEAPVRPLLDSQRKRLFKSYVWVLQPYAPPGGLAGRQQRSAGHTAADRTASPSRSPIVVLWNSTRLLLDFHALAFDDK